MKSTSVLRKFRIYMEALFSSKAEIMLKAIAENKLKDIKCLVENLNLDIVKPLPSSITFLHYAAMFGSPEIVKYFIKNGAIIDHKDQLGCTPLARAVHLDNRANVEVLINAGANKENLDHYSGDEVTITEYAHIKHYKDLYDLLETQKKEQQNREQSHINTDMKKQKRVRNF